MKYFERMKRSISFLMALAVLGFTFTSCSDDENDPAVDPVDEVVVIEDSELLEIILDELNIQSAGALTKARMMELTELNVSNAVLSTFSGIEEAENLEVLYARSVEVEDLTPISSLTNLIVLDMRDAVTPTSLSFLAPLENIENIDFQNTAVADISALAGKTSLTHINLRETDVSDISALEGMTQLQFLNLNRAGGGNGITNPGLITPMENLYYLSLRNTVLGDELFAEIFANKTKLVESNIRNTGITSVMALVPLFEAGAFTEALSEEFDNKISLDIQNNAITDLCAIYPWVGNFPEGELEWSSAAGDFSDCD
ncbi:leucine-rich repeat domain-containing protein [Belliella sp. DSM 111904]|uniref:Leucine-rich repeat domain-containing protein n=1 Tax=Belliella filtrata TaxID=2923435 RepID=A0ABS9V1D3_9BACT|nr:leucine-rich repeat domain-containing protein [Belliella filtrata]MCH7410222.1 leucine-rich repeat domain-containing protein [Belliella filtrata]